MAVLSPKTTLLLNPLLGKDQAKPAALSAGPTIPPISTTLAAAGAFGYANGASADPNASTSISSAIQALSNYVNAVQSVLRNYASTLLQIVLDLSDARAMEYVLTLTNGAHNDVVFGQSSTSIYAYLKITGPSGGFSISGFNANAIGANNLNGYELRVWNSTAQQMTIKNLSGSSSGNQIDTCQGADVVLRAGKSFAEFIYSVSSKVWVLKSYN